MRIAICCGTRPEFVKLAPVVQELRRRGESPQIISTGQHTDLLRGTPFEDGMAPDVNLKLPGTNDPIRYAGLLDAVLRAQWAHDKPEFVVVQGDTASAYAGALAASQLEIPVGHVEAGIRSGDLQDPFPEEQFRIEIDDIARWRFAPTEYAYEQLETMRSNPYDLVTGNPGIDALYSHTKPVEESQKVERVLITLHRRESFGEPLARLVIGIHEAAIKYPSIEFVWPTHPNPEVQKRLPYPNWRRNLILQRPIGTIEFARMLATSRAVITDSGGVQEEAAALGIPCVVARERTDRPESVELGLARIAGRTEAGILSALAWALGARCDPSDCFGDGHASERIVGHLLA